MIVTEHVVNMVEHWLNCPPNGYFGQGYGSDVKAMLLQLPTSDNADKFIEKLKKDIPLLANLDDEQLSIEVEHVDFDKEYIYLFIGSISFQIGKANTIRNNIIEQDYYDSRAK